MGTSIGAAECILLDDASEPTVDAGLAAAAAGNRHHRTEACQLAAAARRPAATGSPSAANRSPGRRARRPLLDALDQDVVAELEAREIPAQRRHEVLAIETGTSLALARNARSTMSLASAYRGMLKFIFASICSTLLVIGLRAEG